MKLLSAILAVLLSCCAVPAAFSQSDGGIPDVTSTVAEIDIVGIIDESLFKAVGAAVNEAAKQKPPPTAIIFHIDSIGGEMSTGMQMARAIEALPVPVTCTVDGFAASIAFYILQSCKLRIATERSIFMTHEATHSAGNNLSIDGLQNLVGRLRVYNIAIAKHISARLNISTAEYIRRVRGKEWTMTPEEALKLGAIDMVIPSPNSQYVKTK